MAFEEGNAGILAPSQLPDVCRSTWFCNAFSQLNPPQSHIFHGSFGCVPVYHISLPNSTRFNHRLCFFPRLQLASETLALWRQFGVLKRKHPQTHRDR
jgi:hypothetical protein